MELTCKKKFLTLHNEEFGSDLIVKYDSATSRSLDRSAFAVATVSNLTQ